jgi:hypothetical protein
MNDQSDVKQNAIFKDNHKKRLTICSDDEPKAKVSSNAG